MMNDFVIKVRETIAEYGMFGGARAVCAALSGGADSVSLLLALCELKDEFGVEVFACHLNHGLRGEESDSDEKFCRALCERLNIPIFAEKIDVRALSKKHESVETTARNARYNFFENALSHFGAGCVLATAHTANDSAETVLLNLTRGTGLAGLCGIPPVRKLGERQAVRPLIRCTREEIERYLADCGQDFVTDKTNLSEEYTRNKLRLRVLPTLAEINPSVLSVISRMTENLRADNAFLGTLAENALEKTRTGRGWNAAEIAKLPPAVKSRVVREILRQGGIEPSALRIETAVSLLKCRSARFNPCRDRFFTIRKGVCFVEEIKQNYRKK